MGVLRVGRGVRAERHEPDHSAHREPLLDRGLPTLQVEVGANYSHADAVSLGAFTAAEIRRESVSIQATGSYETKALLDCALWELDIVGQDYGTRADTMLQHQQFVRALNSQARLKGFEPTASVWRLYGLA